MAKKWFSKVREWLCELGEFFAKSFLWNLCVFVKESVCLFFGEEHRAKVLIPSNFFKFLKEVHRKFAEKLLRQSLSILFITTFIGIIGVLLCFGPFKVVPPDPDTLSDSPKNMHLLKDVLPEIGGGTDYHNCYNLFFYFCRITVSGCSVLAKGIAILFY